MVLQKRLHYGFDGSQAPPIPRGPRSLRRKGPLRKKSVDNEMCAINLLASVADKILLEQQSPTTASSDGMCHKGSIPGIVKEERQHVDHKLVGIHNHSIPEIGLDVVEILNNEGGFSSGSASALTKSGCADKTGFDEEKPLNDHGKDGMCHKGSIPGIVKEERQLDDHKLVGFHNQSSLEIGLDVVEITNNEGGFSSGSASALTNSGCTDKTGFDDKKPLNDGKEKFQSQIGEASFGFGSDTCSSEDLEFLDRNLSKSDKYVYNIDVKVHRDHYTCGFPSPCRNNVNLLVSKDDDDNSSECTKRSTVMKTIGDRRTKKLVAPRCSRAPPKVNIRNLSHSGVEMHTIYQNRRRGSKCPRSQRIYPFKKRKLLHTTSDDTTRCDYEDIYEPLEKATNISASDFETSELSEAAGQSVLITPRESNVRLRIQSFRVPELFIELPETATVGSLKKTAMDAIKTLLGNGLHIGVLVQGRKIKDDSLTLLQSGISHDTLGFTLEPKPSRIHKSLSSEQPFIEVPPEPLSSSSKEKGAGDSKALVEVPELNVQALSLFAPPPPPPPPLEKSKRSENAQRRMRRPFSVSEVEALVQAVQELGTGRWRDVKMRAFDTINHRTYVDLKDKWKTLVHTARISPQQRRGEPVPQELLDRVLAAHSYWSYYQAKHQSDTCLLV